MKSIIKYHNDFNQIELRSFREVELDIFFSIILEMRDKGTAEVVLDFENIVMLSRSKNSTRFLTDLESVILKLTHIGIREVNEEGVINYRVIFRGYNIDPNKKTFSMKTNPEFVDYFNNIIANYTKFDLLEFTSLKSTYSKMLYRHLHQYKINGVFQVTIEDFRKLMSVPIGYTLSNLNARVINPSIAELKPIFKGLKLTKIRDGRKIKTLKFTFRKFTNETKSTGSGKIINVPVQEEKFTSEETANVDPIEIMNKARKEQGLPLIKQPKLTDYINDLSNKKTVK